ncbi:uncharacterized protein LOC116140914 [Pistacia vera]|uniref:uncharacterized protein LOC116140914 n=1 Tax=Pistacia vera TaxID=55513 RepID=UPI001263848C|nr:uncharacterized protein LOC116140914 [Pistacia vera]
MLLAQDKSYKKGFRFDHVWPILKDIEKFADNVNAVEVFQRKTDNKFLFKDLKSITDPILREFFQNEQSRIIQKRAQQQVLHQIWRGAVQPHQIGTVNGAALE